MKISIFHIYFQLYRSNNLEKLSAHINVSKYWFHFLYIHTETQLFCAWLYLCVCVVKYLFIVRFLHFFADD